MSLIKPEPQWSVTVECDGQRLLTIETNSLAGKADMTEQDEEIIRIAARNLLGFVGDCLVSKECFRKAMSSRHAKDK